jgi:hypothetical protein
MGFAQSSALALFAWDESGTGQRQLHPSPRNDDCYARGLSAHAIAPGVRLRKRTQKKNYKKHTKCRTLGGVDTKKIAVKKKNLTRKESAVESRCGVFVSRIL